MPRPSSTTKDEPIPGFWKLKAAIAFRRMTQREVARQTRIAETRLSDFIYGRACPTRGEQKKIARVLRLNIAQLFGNDTLEVPA